MSKKEILKALFNSEGLTLGEYIGVIIGSIAFFLSPVWLEWLFNLI
jgi:hypothetical protein